MNPDGSGQVNLTNDPAEDTDPVWSPDGTRIAFVKASEGHDNIWVMNADGTKPHAAHQHDRSAPGREGAGLVARRLPDRLRRGQLGVADERQRHRQVQVVANSVLPAWSPDGTKIVFSSRSFGALNGPDIFTVNPNGTNVTRLPTAANATDTDPNWQPAASSPTTSSSTTTTSTTTTSTTTVLPTTTTTQPTTTTTSTTTPGGTTTTTVSERCAEIRRYQQMVNADLDAREREIRSRNLAPAVERALLDQLRAARAEANNQLNRALLNNGCVTTTSTTRPPTTPRLLRRRPPPPCRRRPPRGRRQPPPRRPPRQRPRPRASTSRSPSWEPTQRHDRRHRRARRHRRRRRLRPDRRARGRRHHLRRRRPGPADRRGGGLFGDDVTNCGLFGPG